MTVHVWDLKKDYKWAWMTQVRGNMAKEPLLLLLPPDPVRPPLAPEQEDKEWGGQLISIFEG